MELENKFKNVQELRYEKNIGSNDFISSNWS